MEPADRPSPASLRHDGTVLPAPSVAAPPRTFVLFFASGRALRPSGPMLPGSDRLLPTFSHGAALWPSAWSDRVVGGVRTGRKPKTADPAGSKENASLGQRLWVAGAAVQRLAARQLSVFTSGANRNAAGMAGAAWMGLLSVFPLAAGHGVSSMGVRLLERPAAAADRPYCCRK